MYSEVSSKIPVLSLHSLGNRKGHITKYFLLEETSGDRLIHSLHKAGSTQKFNSVSKGFVKLLSG